MCLSKVYNKSVSADNLLMSNVQRISFEGKNIVLTDLLENETRIHGRLVLADLVGGKVIVEAD